MLFHSFCPLAIGFETMNAGHEFIRNLVILLSDSTNGELRERESHFIDD